MGKMFLKFLLIEVVRPFCGMYFYNVRTEDYWERDRLGGWERWERNIMRLTDSPYHAYQVVTWANTITLGGMREQSNPFRW